MVAAPKAYIQEPVIFAKILATSHAFSLSSWPPLQQMERGERGVRAGRAQVLSPCPLSIGWRGGAGVRLGNFCTFRPFHPLVRRFGCGCAGLGTARPTLRNPRRLGNPLSGRQL